MNSIFEIITNLKKNTDDNLIMLNQAIGNLPEGTLNCDSKANHISYYQRIRKNGRLVKKYLGKRDEDLVKKLASKDYYVRLLPYLEEEQKALENFLNDYRPDDKYQVYNELSDSRKRVVSPITSPAFSAWQKWIDEPFSPCNEYPEKLIFETDRGEMVRSKSEVIIANLLNSSSDYLDYRYEKGLWLPENGMLVYPDFTIFIKRTGRVIYWEHAGMLDDPEYASKFTRKTNRYILNGIMPGKQLLISFETTAFPLNTQVIKKMINQII